MELYFPYIVMKMWTDPKLWAGFWFNPGGY